MRHPLLLPLCCLIACAEAPQDPVQLPPEKTSSTTTEVGSVSTSTTATSTTSTSSTTPFDCDALPAGPLPFTILPNFGGAEDFDFDAAGNHVAVDSGNLVTRTQAGGAPVPLVLGLGSPINGMRSLPDGDFVIADQNVGALQRVDTATGSTEVLHGNINYPNGADVSNDGKYAFVTENASPGELWQIDLDTLEPYRLITGLSGANGIALSADEQTIYVGTCAGTGIVALDRLGDTDWEVDYRLLVDDPQGCYDAINVDACGNLYFYGDAVYRMSADGLVFEEVADFAGWKWLPNARWGPDVGGWASDILYFNSRMDDGIIALEVGVPGRPHVHAP